MFHVEFVIDENDYLTHHLFTASKSETIKKKRLRSRWIIPVLYILLAVLMFTDHIWLALLFIIFGSLWFLLYPLWEKRRFVTHYKNHIKENYKGKMGRAAALDFYDDYITAKDEGGETKVFTKEIVSINEIPTTILIKFKSGNSLILPKSKIHNCEELKQTLKTFATKLDKPYIIEDNWQWR